MTTPTSNQPTQPPLIIIIPGNGDPDFDDSWYNTVAADLRAAGYEVHSESFPDSELASESVWVPHVKSIAGDRLANTILIGHSSGCECAMRLVETDRVLGIVLVSACHTDMGDEHEAAAGYYSRPWGWSAMQRNTTFRVQLGSTDDPLIPFDTEQQYVADHLHTDLRVFKNRGHFLQNDLPEIVAIVKQHAPLANSDNSR